MTKTVLSALCLCALPLLLAGHASAAISLSPGHTSFVSASVSSSIYQTANFTSLPASKSVNVSSGNSYAKTTIADVSSSGFTIESSMRFDNSAYAAGAPITRARVYGYVYLTVDQTSSVTYTGSVDLTSTGTGAAVSDFVMSIFNVTTGTYLEPTQYQSGEGVFSIDAILNPNNVYRVTYQEWLKPATGATGLTTADATFNFVLNSGNIPEPASLALIASAGAALLMRRRR